jgi:hypothetical protein
VPQRLPNAPESRVLLALYHKGPLTRTQLVNLEAIPLAAYSTLNALLEKTLIALPEERTYQLTAAGHDLCEVCLKYDLMIETHYRSDTSFRELARRIRQNEVLEDFLEGDFREVNRASRAPAAAPDDPPEAPPTESLSKAPPIPALPSVTLAAPAPATTPPIAPKPPLKPAAHAIPLPPPRIYSSVRRK